MNKIKIYSHCSRGINVHERDELDTRWTIISWWNAVECHVILFNQRELIDLHNNRGACRHPQVRLFKSVGIRLAWWCGTKIWVRRWERKEFLSLQVGPLRPATGSEDVPGRPHIRPIFGLDMRGAGGVWGPFEASVWVEKIWSVSDRAASPGIWGVTPFFRKIGCFFIWTKINYLLIEKCNIFFLLEYHIP